MRSRPVITLTTDFGLADHYAGVMKGVILTICPEARIVDITHECCAYDVSGAAFTIAQAYPYFPPKSVHVVVVDPGVGTARRPILIEAGGQFFVGPDNGVFELILAQERARARILSNRKYFLDPVSQTFHGRDIFAPVAAHLAKGVSPSRIGPRIDDCFQTRQIPPSPGTGAVLHVDRFGNIVTSFLAADFPVDGFEISVGSRRVTRLASDYAQAGRGKLFAIFGSSGYVEISAGQSSAAKILGVSAGAPLKLRRR